MNRLTLSLQRVSKKDTKFILYSFSIDGDFTEEYFKQMFLIDVPVILDTHSVIHLKTDTRQAIRQIERLLKEDKISLTFAEFLKSKIKLLNSSTRYCFWRWKIRYE